MLTYKEFLDKDFRAWCQQEYDRSRYFLKNGHKPENEIDVWFFKFHRETTKIFKEFLK